MADLTTVDVMRILELVDKGMTLGEAAAEWEKRKAVQSQCEHCADKKYVNWKCEHCGKEVTVPPF